MLQNILNLEGVAVLNKEQQKTIKGGGGEPEDFYVRNLKATGKIMEYNGGVKACECSWEVSENGKDNWTLTYGPCPSGELEWSCI